MRQIHGRAILAWGLVVVVCLIVGGLGGKFSASVFGKREEAARQEHRLLLQKQILGQMKTLEIGDTLIDQEFDDLDGRTYRLSDCVKGGGVIGIISPDCMICAEEVSGLAKLVQDSVLRNRVVFLSAGNVQELDNLKRLSNLSNHFLCDRTSAWTSQYKIFTYPFNIVVDERLVIQNVIPAALLLSDIQAIPMKTVMTR